MSVAAWVLAVAAAALFGLYLSMTAGRLDRLHRRIDTARLALDVHLLRRAAMAVEVAASGLLDPAASLVLGGAAHAARAAADDDPARRGLAESDLTRALAAAFADSDDLEALREDPDGAELAADLVASTHRVELSRRFLNDAVRACRAVRRQQVVRVFGLAGRTSLPETFEMDDTVPPGVRT